MRQVDEVVWLHGVEVRVDAHTHQLLEQGQGQEAGEPQGHPEDTRVRDRTGSRYCFGVKNTLARLVWPVWQNREGGHQHQ